jgi:hypothetical protein
MDDISERSPFNADVAGGAPLCATRGPQGLLVDVEHPAGVKNRCMPRGRIAVVRYGAHAVAERSREDVIEHVHDMRRRARREAA